MVCYMLTRFPCTFRRLLILSFQFHTQSGGAMVKGKNALPDRWTEYIPVGKRIPGTRFIAFKVPLKQAFNTKLAPWQRFSPSDLIKQIESQNEELGLIVDLTCTTRYYWPGELPKNVKYAKLFTAGHEVPNDEVIYQFKCIVKQFLKENSDNDKLVGVHCTHGLNRTGYIVCRYLIDVLGMVPADAIEKFNQSRGHCIERENYLDDLTFGNMRNNAGADKPRLPLAKNQQYVPGVNDDQPRPARFANSVDAPRIPEPRRFYPPAHHMPAPMYNMPPAGFNPHQNFRFAKQFHPPMHNMPAPAYNIPPMEFHHHQAFGGWKDRRRHQHRRPNRQQNGTYFQPGNPNPSQDSAPHRSEDSGPYKRYPAPSRGGKSQK